MRANWVWPWNLDFVKLGFLTYCNRVTENSRNTSLPVREIHFVVYWAGWCGQGTKPCWATYTPHLAPWAIPPPTFPRTFPVPPTIVPLALPTPFLIFLQDILLSSTLASCEVPAVDDGSVASEIELATTVESDRDGRAIGVAWMTKAGSITWNRMYGSICRSSLKFRVLVAEMSDGEDDVENSCG